MIEQFLEAVAKWVKLEELYNRADAVYRALYRRVAMRSPLCPGWCPTE
jgi:hypothetical protein